MNNEQNEREIEIDLLSLVRALLARWKFILLTAVLFAAAAFIYSKVLVTPRYTASVSMYINNNKTQLSDNLDYNDINASTMLIPTYMELFKSDAVLQPVADKLGNDYEAEDLASMLSLSTSSDTQLVYLNVTSVDSEQAYIIANAIADNAPQMITNIMSGGSIKIIDYAKQPEHSSYPNVPKNTLVGLMLGLILSMGAVVLMELLDTRIKGASDISAMYEDIPILGTVPAIKVQA